MQESKVIQKQKENLSLEITQYPNWYGEFTAEIKLEQENSGINE